MAGCRSATAISLLTRVIAFRSDLALPGVEALVDAVDLGLVERCRTAGGARAEQRQRTGCAFRPWRAVRGKALLVGDVVDQRIPERARRAGVPGRSWRGVGKEALQ